MLRVRLANYIRAQRMCIGQMTSDAEVMKIGEVSRHLKHSRKPEFVPREYVKGNLSASSIRNLKWIMQKDNLRQDLFLIGSPGSSKRMLAMQYLELTKRECEYLVITRDTTEADMKQRREIVGSTAKYVDQGVIRAAVEGRVLVLEGIEKAERNVLPILNNLLENREMNLDDGRLLISSEKYDALLKEHSESELNQWGLVRVSEEFRIFALGLPVPKFKGHSLDPPLRSRFQCRVVSPPTFKEMFHSLSDLAPNVSSDKLSQLLSFVYGLQIDESSRLGLPEFPVDNLLVAAKIWVGNVVSLLVTFAQNINPHYGVKDIVQLLYPYSVFFKKDAQNSVNVALEAFGISANEKEAATDVILTQVTPRPSKGALSGVVEVSWRKELLKFNAPWGRCSQSKKQVTRAAQESIKSSSFISTPLHDKALCELLCLHAAGDFAVLGERGCGKTTMIKRLVDVLNYNVVSIMLFQDMTIRDLLQQRYMLPNGDTAWKLSPLIEAALAGDLVVLDGIHRLHNSVISALHRLINDREFDLFDGTRLLSSERYDKTKISCGLSDEDMSKRKLWRIHPSFRIIGVGDLPNLHDNNQQWLAPELLALFPFYHLKPLSAEDTISVISSKNQELSRRTQKCLTTLLEKLRKSPDANMQSLSSFISTRQLLKIARKVTQYNDVSLYDTILMACMARFLPKITKDNLLQTIAESGIQPQSHAKSSDISWAVKDGNLHIGNVVAPVYETQNKTLVPNILFYDNEEHLLVLQDMLRDFNLGEHLLLIGNQGVGKNKVADRLLQLLNRPREYIQLHRDTTVQTLTLQSSIKDGVVQYEDSPLVKAIKFGHILIIDEADKAPTHVTCILKSLLDSGEMFLADGRRVVPKNSSHLVNDDSNVIEIHPDFRVIVLANRPGFPFLGNDFWAAMGDLFACHVVENPSTASELSMLRRYGPSVPEAALKKLSSAFGELREMADNSVVNYPYSIREVVNIVKHLEKYPKEPLAFAVKNAFDFDSFSKDTLNIVGKVLQRHGIPFGKEVRPEVRLAKCFPIREPKLLGTWGPRPSDVKNGVSSTVDPLACTTSILPINAVGPNEVEESTFVLQKFDSRAETFSELESYWQLPLHNANIISDIVVSEDKEIFLATVNPIGVYHVRAAANVGSFTDLSAYFPKSRGGVNAAVKICALKGRQLGGCLFIHEENSNNVCLYDTRSKTIHRIETLKSSEDQTGVLENATKALKDVAGRFMKPDSGDDFECRHRLISADENVIGIFTEGGNDIELFNFNTGMRTTLKTAGTVCLRECFFASKEKLLISTDDWKWYLFDTVKNNLEPIHVDEPYGKSGAMSEILSACSDISMKGLIDPLLEATLKQKIKSPNRLLSYCGSEDYFASVSVGFPELESPGDVVLFAKDKEAFVEKRIPYWLSESALSLSSSKSKVAHLPQIGQIVYAIPEWKLPAKAQVKDQGQGSLAGYLEVVDLPNRQVSYLPVAGPKTISPYGSWISSLMEALFLIHPYGDEGVVTADVGGGVRIWETSGAAVRNSLAAWKRLMGTDDAPSDEIVYEGKDPDLKKLAGPKHGVMDPTGAPHHGGNTFAGGSGGRDTAGLGGVGGPYRLDLGHEVHQVSDAVKQQVPEHVREQARKIAEKAYKQALKEIQMSEFDAELYDNFFNKIERQTTALRLVIENLQAKAKDRQWVRHQTSGDFDDGKLIEGVTGEKTVYRRRSEKEPEPGAPLQKPKRLRLCVDVSGSMYRFNGYDNRLQRTLESCLMVMNAFKGYEHKFKYDIVGHSGETPSVTFVNADRPPTNKKEQLESLKMMLAHSQFCYTGDNTLEATDLSVKQISKEDADEHFVIVLSDANFDRYGIRPADFVRAMTDAKVNVFVIFIGSLGNQAMQLQQKVPPGRAFVCKETREMPEILQQIFTSNLLSSSTEAS